MDENIIHCCGQAVLREIAGEYVLVPVGETAMKTQRLICLTESSAMLWKMIVKGTTKEEMCQALLDTYEVEKRAAAKDIDQFLETLHTLSLV